MAGAGLIVGTIGAVLWLAVEPPSATYVDLPTLGLILLATGVLLIFLAAWREVAVRPRPRRRPGPPPADRYGPPEAETDPAVRRPVWEQTGYTPPRRPAPEPATEARDRSDDTQLLPTYDEDQTRRLPRDR